MQVEYGYGLGVVSVAVARCTLWAVESWSWVLLSRQRYPVPFSSALLSMRGHLGCAGASSSHPAVSLFWRHRARLARPPCKVTQTQGWMAWQTLQLCF